jgi:hypothetical protein
VVSTRCWAKVIPSISWVSSTASDALPPSTSFRAGLMASPVAGIHALPAECMPHRRAETPRHFRKMLRDPVMNMIGGKPG